jgi:hypothetical protein
MAEEQIDMLLECVFSYKAEEQSDGSLEIHMRIPSRFRNLWIVKLNRLRTTIGEIEEYEREEGDE